MMALVKGDTSFCITIACRIIKVLENKEIPWQRPWTGWSVNIGYPANIRTETKFSGINFILCQLASKKHKFISKWWGEQFDFDILSYTIHPRPDEVIPGEWCTQAVLYNKGISSIRLYNADQCCKIKDSLLPRPKLKPDYILADNVLHSTNADIKFTESDVSFYHYHPDDYITMPKKEIFESGLGKLPSYYDTLAHELMHWTEDRLEYNLSASVPERELRAEIGAAMLAEELHFPHNIINSNFEKWREAWIAMIRDDVNSLFRAAEGAFDGANYILGTI